ncbi:MAG: hypothetical protein QWI73_05260 [Alphaproteobacteria bacterium]|nr:hypothetical protein [Alphaproteobacteria bacterium]
MKKTKNNYRAAAVAVVAENDHVKVNDCSKKVVVLADDKTSVFVLGQCVTHTDAKDSVDAEDDF